MRRPASIALCLAGAPFVASATASESSDLHARLDAIERRIALLAAGEDDDAFEQRRAAEIRALARRIALDASTRSSFRSVDVVAGWDGHPFIASADGGFLLELAGRVQVRYVHNFQDGDDVDGSRGGFENRRTRVNFGGHVIDPTWEYTLQTGFDRSSGRLELLNAYLRKALDDGVYVQFGQQRPPFLRESTTSSGRQLAIERSLIHSAFGVGRSQGVEVGVERERFALRGAFSDGDGGENVGAFVEDTEYALSARAAWLPVGEWRGLRDFTSAPDDEPLLLFAAAAHYEVEEFGTSGPPETDDFRWQVEASAEFGGANAFATFVHRQLDRDGADTVDQFGVLLHGGVYITDDFEFFARYQWGDDDRSAADLHVVEAGFNRYFDRHDLKWTTDVGYAFDAVSDFFASGGAGWREDAPNEDGQLVVRSQLQLQF